MKHFFADETSQIPARDVEFLVMGNVPFYTPRVSKYRNGQRIRVLFEELISPCCRNTKSISARVTGYPLARFVTARYKGASRRLEELLFPFNPNRPKGSATTSSAVSHLRDCTRRSSAFSSKRRFLAARRERSSYLSSPPPPNICITAMSVRGRIILAGGNRASRGKRLRLQAPRGSPPP